MIEVFRSHERRNEIEMEQKWSNFRSDTVTLPTAEMRAAMAQAEVGDDVYGEDPTVNRLEAIAAAKVGKEAALFVTSGTQGNLVSVLAHTRQGDEVLLEKESHIYYYEVGGMSAVGGLIPRLLESEGGIFSADAVRKALRGENIHFPRTSLLCLENTHNRAGGTYWTPAQVAEVSEGAKEAGLKVHVDGARIFNAAVAQGIDVKELTAPVDSVQFCLSKGLGAPVGSMVAGSREFIARARKWRKMLGGGMRQAGVLAAAGMIALEKMVDRLAEDHALARKIGQEIAEIPALSVDLARLQTNIVVVSVDPAWGTATELLGRLREHGILATDFGPQKVRCVTHEDVGAEDAQKLIQALKEIMV